MDVRAWHGLRSRDVHRGKHSRDSAYAERSRALAFRRQDDAHTLRRGRHGRPQLRAYRTQRADAAGGGARSVRMGSPVNDQKERKLQSINYLYYYE